MNKQDLEHYEEQLEIAYEALDMLVPAYNDDDELINKITNAHNLVSDALAKLDELIKGLKVES